MFARLGGTQVWIGRPELTLIGPESEAWDIAFIAQYPSGQAFIDMIRDPIYREAVKHRQAAVADSRLIRLRPAEPGASFGEEGGYPFKKGARRRNIRFAAIRPSPPSPTIGRSSCSTAVALYVRVG